MLHPKDTPSTKTSAKTLSKPHHHLVSAFEKAGIQVNGSEPWDIQVHDERFWRRLLLQGSLGLGESYMDGWWDCERIDQMIYRLLRYQENWKTVNPAVRFYNWAFKSLVNLQSMSRAFHIGKVHYDIGNDLYRAMLDQRMVYTCGYWQSGAQSLDEAQLAKLELICKKLQLEAGMRILDIGCGWGSFIEYAARNYDVECVGLTVSKEQVKLTTERCRGLAVDVRLQDYREIDEKFDRVLSVGMFEHVGSKNYRTYMQVTRNCLQDNGLALLHTIGGNQSYKVGDRFMTKYIFPNGHIPSIAQIGEAMEGLFVAEDLHNFGSDYDRTLMAWHHNIENSWSELQQRNPHYNDRFQRMWRYYLLSCAAAFRARKTQLWQWVLSTRSAEKVYPRVT